MSLNGKKWAFYICMEILKLIYQLILMLSQEVNQKFLSNLTYEKINSVQRNTDHLISEQDYKDLMGSIFEEHLVVPLSFSPFSSFQYCGQLGLSQKTAYLAKIYLDIMFNKSNFIDFNQLSKLSLCCLWVAIKFNEPESISQYFDAATICSQGQDSFTSDDLLATENSLRELLQFKFKYTTPYDYIQPFFQTFPWYTKAKTVLKSLIELAGSTPSLRNDSSGDIFYGSFIAVCKLKNCILQPIQNSILRSQIRQQQRVQAISEEIIARYYQILVVEGEDSALKRKQTSAE